MEYREAELREVVPNGVPEDDPARFLRELRQLRNGAGLGHAELAARAHYPCDAILAAEAGPALPDLPVLSAYVRGCGGTVIDWEERWRTLTRSPALTLLPTRDAGGSDAAVAGARIGSVSLAADGHDPAIIMAALGRVANGIAAEPSTRAAALAAPARAPMAERVFGIPERAAATAGSSMRTSTSVLGASVPAADAMPTATSDTVATPAPAADTGSLPGEATAPEPAPSVASAEPATGGPSYTRRSGPSKQLIAALVIVVCLLAIVLALFALSTSSGLVRSYASIRAVQVVARGEALLSPSVTRRLITSLASAAVPHRAPVPVPGLARLTEREREVLALVAEGLSNDEIAGRLYLSPLTTKTHVSRILTKLDARDRAQLVVIAYESGLVVPGSATSA